MRYFLSSDMALPPFLGHRLYLRRLRENSSLLAANACRRYYATMMAKCDASLYGEFLFCKTDIISLSASHDIADNVFPAAVDARAQ